MAPHHLLACILVVSHVLGCMHALKLSPDDFHYCGKNPDGPVPVVPPLQHQSQSATLKQAIAVFRHGDRTSSEWYPLPNTFGTKKVCWPNDKAIFDCKLTHNSIPGLNPIDSESDAFRLYRKVYMDGRNMVLGTCMSGQLTSRGYDQQFNGNGAMLRQAYVNRTKLLPDELTVNNTQSFFFRSDDYPRTVQSLEALLLGMYPTQKRSGEALIDIHTLDVVGDDIIPNTNLCPRLKEVIDEGMSSAAFKLFTKETLQPLGDKIGSILGLPSLDLDDLYGLHDCTFAHVCHSMPLPDGFTEDLVNDLDNAINWVTNFQAVYPDPISTGKLGMGLLIGELYDWMNATIHQQQGPKLVLVSGHDSTLMPLLSAFQLQTLDSDWAAYASMVIFEVYTMDNSGKGAIRMIYDQKEMLLPGCSDVLCDFEEFTEIVQQLRISWPQDCVPTSVRNPLL